MKEPIHMGSMKNIHKAKNNPSEEVDSKKKKLSEEISINAEREKKLQNCR